jgi:hypothetical protein
MNSQQSFSTAYILIVVGLLGFQAYGIVTAFRNKAVAQSRLFPFLKPRVFFTLKDQPKMYWALVLSRFGSFAIFLMVFIWLGVRVMNNTTF